jgi:hypothetical protein
MPFDSSCIQSVCTSLPIGEIKGVDTVNRDRWNRAAAMAPVLTVEFRRPLFRGISLIGTGAEALIEEVTALNDIDVAGQAGAIDLGCSLFSIFPTQARERLIETSRDISPQEPSH